MSDLMAWLRAQLDEDERLAIPRTIANSGGHPAPVVPNCVGPSGTGDCSEQWRIDPAVVPAEEWPALERAHALTHATADQRFALADIAAKRAILDEIVVLALADDSTDETAWHLLRLLASAYAGRPGYQEEWRT